jgi:hypothetical protein
MEKAVPGLRNRIPSHHRYAEATLPEILGQEAFSSARVLNVNIAESCVLVNQGQATFTCEPLPRLAQVAPINGLALADIDGDGHLDLVVAQNFYPMHRESGRLAGGASLLLAGKGNGSFSPLWPNQSGILIPGEARSITLADLNQDGWPDPVFALHNNHLFAYTNRLPKTNRLFAVRLKGPKPNQAGIGAKVTLRLTSGATRSAELYAGSGGLSQSESTLRFGLGASLQPASVEVRWPNVTTNSQQVPPGTLSLTIPEPSK